MGTSSELDAAAMEMGAERAREMGGGGGRRLEKRSSTTSREEAQFELQQGREFRRGREREEQRRARLASYRRGDHENEPDGEELRGGQEGAHGEDDRLQEGGRAGTPRRHGRWTQGGAANAVEKLGTRGTRRCDARR
jgi:hypothetical protein